MAVQEKAFGPYHRPTRSEYLLLSPEERLELRRSLPVGALPWHADPLAISITPEAFEKARSDPGVHEGFMQDAARREVARYQEAYAKTGAGLHAWRAWRLMRVTQQDPPDWVTDYLDRVAAALEGLGDTRSIAAALDLHNPKGGDRLLPVHADRQLSSSSLLLWAFQRHWGNLLRARARRKLWATQGSKGDDFWNEIVDEAEELEAFDAADPIDSVRQAEHLVLMGDPCRCAMTRRELRGKWEEEDRQLPQTKEAIYQRLSEDFGVAPATIKAQLRRLGALGTDPKGVGVPPSVPCK